MALEQPSDANQPQPAQEYALSELVAMSRPLLRAAYGCETQWTEDGGYPSAHEWLTKLIASVHQELTRLDDLPAAVRFAFDDHIVVTAPMTEAVAHAWVKDVLTMFMERLQPLSRTEPEKIADLFKDLRAACKEKFGLRGREVMTAVRAALTGTIEGPCLEVVVCLLGRRRCLERVNRYLAGMKPS